MYDQQTYMPTRSFMVIDSRKRQGGTSSEYEILTPSIMFNVARVRLCWIMFFDAATKEPVDVFRKSPYIQLHIDAWTGSHNFSSRESVSNAFAVIPRDFDDSTITILNDLAFLPIRRVYRLFVAFLDADGNMLPMEGIEHAFMVEIEFE